ncbi:DUF924 family protein [Marinomonas epiphytica]
MTIAIERILEFWFGPMQNGWPCTNKNSIWWGGGEVLDRSIQQEFGSLLQQAANDELAAWKEEPKGRMALIILLDQFSRNIYRNQSQAFAADSLAQKYCLEGIEIGYDQTLQTAEKLFFYLPLVHSETLPNHEKAVTLFSEVVATARPEHYEHTTKFLESAYEHKAIIEEYGRYPYRNKVLGRVSTPAEMVYLASSPNTFGQGK